MKGLKVPKNSEGKEMSKQQKGEKPFGKKIQKQFQCCKKSRRGAPLLSSSFVHHVKVWKNERVGRLAFSSTL